MPLQRLLKEGIINANVLDLIIRYSINYHQNSEIFKHET